MAGLIAGVFLLQATQSMLSAVIPVTFPIGEFTSRLAGAAVPFVGALLQAFLGWAYLRGNWKKWLYVLTIALLSLSGCGAVIRMIIPFLHITIERARASLVVSGMTDLAVHVIMIGCVFIMMKSARSDETAQP